MYKISHIACEMHVDKYTIAHRKVVVVAQSC